ncbi:hypothetical protein ACPOL_0432 [Acidisarcina polymorpha]|uniref:Uncharacterized protein n=1 Tax=Acidisarcina polymorpha TaxID=2211140 RepID=A0A2Z5FSL1_9BACT|nr:hypothetical protein [Acidisarcina polymorpha]AXC09809.1 hypothetical protein ACPOL_0432 [Acidisarcina polymorpha]
MQYRSMHLVGMETRAQLEAIDKVGNGVVVAFDDGQTAFFSAALLHSMLSQAKPIKKCSED